MNDQVVKKDGGLIFQNPVITQQMGEAPFVADSYIGHTMPPGKDFIGEREYVDMGLLLKQLKKTHKKIILNIGDSSTSGWDSNVVTDNKERLCNNLPLLPALFQYKTYSDFLREDIGDEYEVINAGVPAHTSLQGNRRLELLLNEFYKEGLSIDWVTAYYGNNDSVWDCNRQDKLWVGHKTPVRSTSQNISSLITRVSIDDYKANMFGIIKKCQSHGVGIIIVEPQTPIYWKPGTRVLHEELERKNGDGAEYVYSLLDEALVAWEQAIKQEEFSALKQIVLEEVREKDYIVPRIKKEHLYALRTLTKELSTEYVNIQLDRTIDDIRYFIDYCHPIEEANMLIAKGIAAIIQGKIAKKTIENKLYKPANKQENKLDLPVAHYTLY